MEFKIKNNLFYFCLFLKVIFFNNCMLLRKDNDTTLEMESAGVENKEINFKNQNRLKPKILMKNNKSTTFKYEYSDLFIYISLFQGWDISMKLIYFNVLVVAVFIIS
jgi:hypothetical protein